MHEGLTDLTPQISLFELRSAKARGCQVGVESIPVTIVYAKKGHIKTLIV